MNEQQVLEAVFKVTGIEQFLDATDAVSKSLGGIEKPIKESTSGIKGFAGSIGKMAGAIGITKVVSAGFNAIRSSVDGAVSRVDTLNQFPRVLEQMGYSTEEASKATDRLSDGIQGLPTRLDEVVGTTQRFTTAFGDVDLATESTLALNNALLASGADSQGAANATDQYVKALSSGKLEMDTWNTLSEQMSYALSEVAEDLGVADGDIWALYDSIKAGDITLDEFNNAMIEASNETGGFAETALTASEGIRTSWTNIQTAITTGVANVIQAINDWMEDSGLGSIASQFDRVKEAVQGAFGYLVENIPIVMNGVMGLFDTIQNSTAFQTMRDIIQQVIDKGQELIAAFLESEAWANFKSLMGDVAQAILDIDFSQVLQDVSEFIDKWSPLIAGILGAVAAFKIISGVISGFKTAVTLVTTAVKLGGAAIAFLTSPIGLAVAAIGIIIAIGVLLYKNWDTIKAKAQDLGNRIKTIFNSMKTSVSNAINNVKTAVSNGLNKAYNTVTGFFGKFKTAGSNIISNIADGIKGAIGKVTGAVKGVLKAARNLLPFSPPKDKSSPMVGLEKNGIVDNIAQGIMNNEGEIQRAMNRALDVDMPMVNGRVKHHLAENKNSQPVIHVHNSLNVGGYEFRGFVDNITEVQDKKMALEMAYL